MSKCYSRRTKPIHGAGEKRKLFAIGLQEARLRPNVILIDLENVQPASLEALAADHFQVKLFVGPNQAKLSVDLVRSVQKLGTRAEYVMIAGAGKNALDFHIAYYIGRIAAEHPDTFFHIISKDKGFDPLIQHLKGNNIFCRRSASPEEIPVVKAMAATSAEERATIFLSKVSQPKATKPRTERTLRSSIAAHFQKQLTEDDVTAIVDILTKRRKLSIDNGKVTFTATTPVSS